MKFKKLKINEFADYKLKTANLKAVSGGWMIPTRNNTDVLDDCDFTHFDNGIKIDDGILIS